ncbi:DNA polymerase III subunits gamma/tau [Rhodococcus spongiicola]|uniref:DNA polymerase III subunit gamma/tau n=1 Tax=Rhodococcus spongiicola TaxID=2487352 RepID=A0A438AQM7_9NOCA|nr:DNA polymerase III subunits gamma/tau [Rhodococcus spongiicola]RVW00922.1 DNA polymerase III subunits gamma/tau [Rhodococcus spongiicola]
MALYRKYRPASFAEVVGQEHVTEPLSTALDAGRITHAYLFSGPRGCGKTSSARILARSLNCVQGPTSSPCGVCASCVALGPGGAGNLDVIELDAASHGGVEDTRELRDRAFYAPAESRYRVFIVDEAHMVTTAGFNALLKIVEEPPEHLIFVFATTEPEKVLPTIRSRTHHYPFRLLAPSTMRGLLERICAQEHVPVEDAVYPLVIRAGGGSPRDSLSLLDQLLAGAGDEGVTYARALALLGVTDVALIDEAVDALAANDGASLFGTIDKVMDAGHDPRRFAVDLLERLRDLILMRAVPDAAERGLVDAPGDVLERMREEAEKIGSATLARYAELAHAGLGEMRGATAPRLLLEVMCARMLLPSATDAESAVLQRLERLERGVSAAPAAPPSATSPSVPAASPAAPRPAPAEPPSAGPVYQRPSQRRTAEVDGAAGEAARTAPEPESASTPAPAPPPAPRLEPVRRPDPEPAPVQQVSSDRPDAAAIRAVWSEVRAKVRERSRTVEVMLSGATVRTVDGSRVVLGHDSAPLAKRLVEPRNGDVIRAALHEVFGGDWEVTCEHGAAPDAASPAQDAPVVAAPQQAKAPAAQRFSRPSQARAVPPPGTPVPEPDDIPPPEAPDYPDDPGPPPPSAVDDGYAPSPPPTTPEDEEEMMAEAAVPVEEASRVDPDDAAGELLTEVLGARQIDG